MFLVLCERGDVAAMWAARGLRARGLAPVEIVSGDEIGCALRIEHRVGAAGVSTELRLPRGLVIGSASTAGILNRLVVPPMVARAAAPADIEYARQEVLALTLSWLHGMPCPVLGRPTAQGLCGPWLRRSEWIALAGRVGFATMPYRRSSLDQPDEAWAGPDLAGSPLRTLLCAVDGDRAGTTAAAVGAPVEIADAAVRLTRLVGATLLGIDLAVGWTFAGASPMPDLPAGHAASLDLIASMLSREVSP